MPGGAGRSWFVIKLRTLVRQGNSWFTTKLDTHGPVATFGSPSGLEQGTLLKVPYTADEFVAKAFLVSGARRVEFVVWGDFLAIVTPSDWPAGPSTIELLDRLDNVAVYTSALTFPGTQPEPEPEPQPLPPAPLVTSSGFISDIARTKIGGQIVVKHAEGELVTASVEFTITSAPVLPPAPAPDLVPQLEQPEPTVEQVLAPLVQLRDAEIVTAEIMITREPAHLLAQQVREDEELLLLLGILA
jgi:hypothetical protein